MSTGLNLSLKTIHRLVGYITAVSLHWPPTSAVDKTSAGTDWEASFNVPHGPEHHLELSSRVCEAWPSLWTWPGECVWELRRGRAGGWIKGTQLRPPQSRQTMLGQMALNIAHMLGSVSSYNKLSSEQPNVYMTWLMTQFAPQGRSSAPLMQNFL